MPVQDHQGLVRDFKSGAILNVDQTEYERYMANYEANQKRKQDLSRLQNEVSVLKSDVSDIKNLLLQLLRRSENDN